MKLRKLALLAVSGLLVSAPGMAQTSAAVAESDWLELVKGHRGETLGAEMREVDSADGTRRVEIAIPKIAIDDPGVIEEVVVVGRAPEESGPLIDMEYEYEWLDDYDEDNYGLVIRLGSDTTSEIRIFMRSQEGFVRQLPADVRLQKP